MASAINICGFHSPSFLSIKLFEQKKFITQTFPSFRVPTSKLPLSSLKICTHGIKHRIVACSNGNGLEKEGLSANMEASFDLKLPRRSLLVQFTCNTCGERTQRLVNRLAYERGTVFVQCAGCLVNHKLVDNLGLVVEYDLREETNGENSDSK